MYLGTSAPFFISYLRTGFRLEKQLFFKLGRYPACKRKKEGTNERKKERTACTDRKIPELQLMPLYYPKTKMNVDHVDQTSDFVDD